MNSAFRCAHQQKVGIRAEWDTNADTAGMGCRPPGSILATTSNISVQGLFSDAESYYAFLLMCLC